MRKENTDYLWEGRRLQIVQKKRTGSYVLYHDGCFFGVHGNGATSYSDIRKLIADFTKNHKLFKLRSNAIHNEFPYLYYEPVLEFSTLEELEVNSFEYRI